MLTLLLKSLSAIFEPEIRIVLWKGVLLSVLLLGALGLGLSILVAELDLFEWAWLDWVIHALGGLTVIVLTVLLFPAVVGLVSSFFLEDVAAAIEARHYPEITAGRRQGLAEVLGVAVRFTALVIAVNILALPVYVFFFWAPLLNILLFYGVNGYILGREYFELVALRHLEPAEARRIYRQYRLRFSLAGIWIAVLLSIPVANILTPLVATAFMVHVYWTLHLRSGRETRTRA
jgi:uncharacterized protein involved in cysteine biosynthesis